jgi:hypothetical protein
VTSVAAIMAGVVLQWWRTATGGDGEDSAVAAKEEGEVVVVVDDVFRMELEELLHASEYIIKKRHG